MTSLRRDVISFVPHLAPVFGLAFCNRVSGAFFPFTCFQRWPKSRQPANPDWKTFPSFVFLSGSYLNLMDYTLNYILLIDDLHFNLSETMKTVKILVPLLVFFILGCGPEVPKTDKIVESFPEIQSEIKTLIDHILKAGAAINLKALDAYHLNSPKFTRVQGSRILSYEEGKKMEENFYGNADILSYAIPDHKVDFYGDMAISSFSLNMTAIVDSDTLHLNSMLSLTFVMDGNEWKIVHEHIGPRIE
jgi:hypothetical protein